MPWHVLGEMLVLSDPSWTVGGGGGEEVQHAEHDPEVRVLVTARLEMEQDGEARQDTWLKVSVNSAGVAGLNLICSATTSSPVVPVKWPDPSKSGTISFPGGPTAAPAKSCG